MGSTVEGVYINNLQGVSQQTISMRLDGQVQAQENMLSDLVTGIRRRPSMPYINTIKMDNVTTSSLYSLYIDRGVDGRHLLINTNTGDWLLLSKDTKNILKQGNDSYFITKKGISSISTAALSMDIYISNSEKTLDVEYSSTLQDPTTTGFAFIRAGNFGITYNLEVVSNGVNYAVSYTTPNGTNAGDVDKSTPTYIMKQLYDKLITAKANDNITIELYNQYLTFTNGKDVNVSTTTGSLYITASGYHTVNTTSDLPPILSSNGNNMIIGVGTNSKALVWYYYNKDSNSWDECGAYGSVTKINNTPKCLESTDDMTTPVFEGRLAGDDYTNDDPAFIKYGIITGIGAYQGRLVILCGAFASLSDSGNQFRFYRRTINSILPSDRIDIGAGSSQNTIFQSCVQFNRDLVLFGDSVQALIASSGNAITSQTAAITLTSEYSCTAKVIPITIGNTLLYPFKRSDTYSGMWELIPSSYTSSQYESMDATAHVPEYIVGEIRHAVSSSSTSIAIVTGDEKDTMYVYEYQWNNDGSKLQAAWHKWIAPLDVASIHFAYSKLYLFMLDPNGAIVTSTIDAREGVDTQKESSIPYLDLYIDVEIKNGEFTLPQHLVSINTPIDNLGIISKMGTYSFGLAGISSINGSTVSVINGVPDGTYCVGIKYKSMLVPTPPTVKDGNDKVISLGHIRLVEMSAIINSTGEFNINVTDSRTGVNFDMPVSGALLNSDDVELDYPLISNNSTVYVPCRTNADTTFVCFYTDSAQGLNIVDISYRLRLNNIRRRV